MPATLAQRMAHFAWRQPVALPEDATPLYERLPSESGKCWAYFCTYRDQGPLRTLEETAKRCGKSYRLISYIAVKFHWRTRVRAWDDYVDRVTQGNAVQRHGEIAARQLEIVEQALDSLDPATLTPRDIARWIEIVTRIQRLAFGEPNDRRAVQHTGTVAVNHDLMERARERIAERLAQIAERDPEPTALDLQRRTMKDTGTCGVEP